MISALGQVVHLIKAYALGYDNIDDTIARDVVQRMINIEDMTLNLREDYWPKFMKALGAKRAAKFYQVDNRLSLLINLQLTAAIPLIPWSNSTRFVPLSAQNGTSY